MVFDRNTRCGDIAAKEAEKLEFGVCDDRVELTEAAVTDHILHDARGR